PHCSRGTSQQPLSRISVIMDSTERVKLRQFCSLPVSIAAIFCAIPSKVCVAALFYLRHTVRGALFPLTPAGLQAFALSQVSSSLSFVCLSPRTFSIMAFVVMVEKDVKFFGIGKSNIDLK
ncbi:hypothetical protein, partial [Prevotella nigrescens]